MAAKNFRSAFNGFNRQDVVHYIEFINNKHAAQLNQLKTELQTLQAELDQQRRATQEIETLSAQLEDANAQIAALEQELEKAYLESGGENRAAGIVMDVNTGAVRAMATKGDFNPNDPFTISEEAEAAIPEQVEKEIARISKELEAAKKFLASLEGKLSNEKFVSRAPEAVVAAEREKAAKHRDLIAQLEQSLAAMQKMAN